MVFIYNWCQCYVAANQNSVSQDIIIELAFIYLQKKKTNIFTLFGTRLHN